MIRSSLKAVKILQAFVISGLLFCVCPDKVSAAPAMIHKIDIQKDPLSVKIFINRNISVKVIRVGKKEILIALTNVTLGKGFKINEQANSLVKKVAVEKMQGNVIAVLLTGHRPYEYMQSGYNKADSSFVLTLEKNGEKKKTDDIPLQKSNAPPLLPEEKESPESKAVQSDKDRGIHSRPEMDLKEEEDDADVSKIKGTGKAAKAVVSKKPDKIAVPPVYVPPKREQSGNNGDISDLIRAMDGAGCDSNLIVDALLLMKGER